MILEEGSSGGDAASPSFPVFGMSATGWNILFQTEKTFWPKDMLISKLFYVGRTKLKEEKDVVQFVPTWRKKQDFFFLLALSVLIRSLIMMG